LASAEKRQPVSGLNDQADSSDLAIPQPKIPPGYQPIDRNTEKGLWMELEGYELSLQQSALLIRDEPINAYVRNAACRVAGEYCRDLRVYVIRNPGFNAMRTANGVMQIWTGLLVRVSSEAELSAVIGHELAHYTQLHTLERLRRIQSNLAASSVIDLLIGLPLSQMAAVANIMSFNREQEEEADLLGVRFMYESGYDPHAAADVWEMIVEEEANAAAKSESGNIFTQTHPHSAQRIQTISDFVEKNYPDAAATPPDSKSHLAMLNRYYLLLMEDQIDTNRFGRTENMLKRHRELGVNPGLIDFFYGEMYRQRKAEGDLDRARQAYERALRSDDTIAQAYRNLGYIQLKLDRPDLARARFRKYLELNPDADDRAMIEFYLEEE
jgi:predicted Zn-dependent protease